MRTMSLPLFAALLATSILAGCGGSSSGQSASTGIYKDAGVVSGLQYKTASQAGVTDSNGTFKYMPGESVTFSVSNVTIGQAIGAPMVTTFDLVGIAPPTSSFGIPTNNPTSKKFQEAINISLFLQTLDIDSDPTNGIAIPAVVNSVVAATPLNFKITTTPMPSFAVQTWSNFQDSPPLKSFISGCRIAGAWHGVKAIKELGYAANSLYKGLGITPSVYLVDQVSGSDGYSQKNEYISSGLISKQDLVYYNSSRQHWTFTYDTNGYETRAVAVDEQPPRDRTTSSTYDANGNLTSLRDETGPYPTETIFEYDVNGNGIRATEYSNGTIDQYTLYTYNPNGTLATVTLYDQGNQLLGSTAFSYNNSLLVTSVKMISGDFSFTHLQTYDDKNNITDLKEFDGSNLRISDTFSYDASGNLIGFSEYFQSILQFKAAFTWDSNGYPVATKFYDADNQLTDSTIGTYDSNGNLIGLKLTGSRTGTSSRTYINQSGWGSLPGTAVDWLRSAY